jgi:epoxyqueuosine reductase
MSLAEAVKTAALQLGFDFAGITTPDPPEHFPIFAGWLEAGRHGEMAYLASERARQRRADPRAILPECQSILVLGVRYDRPYAPAEGVATRLTGRVAAYAWGDDYHDVLVERLKALHGKVEELVNAPVPARWYTDTGPIMERDLAQRAGLGWIGKNTCLIRPGVGSYFFLAEMLLGLELEMDTPFQSDQCGTCTRCLEACPTACILPNRTLDARRCISYLTIELKGAIPPDLRPQMGAWVFGCDICQEVCPWNVRSAPAEGDPAFAPRPGVSLPDLCEELALDQQAFSRKFKGSPVKRTRRPGYLRNVAVALGNSSAPEAIPALATALLTDPEPLVRAHAAWALGRFDQSEARQVLTEAVIIETDIQVLEEIQRVLAQPNE